MVAQKCLETGRAHYLLAELGPQQPRTLAGAFVKSVAGDDLMDASVAALIGFRAQLVKAYGVPSDAHRAMQVGGEGTLADVLAFVRNAGWP